MRATKHWRAYALLLACLAPFFGFWATGLTDLDEGYYGAVVRNMLRTGDWVTPRFDGAPWFEKPILTYWLAAPSVALFGEQFGPRLPSVLCTLATALVLFRFVKRHLDEHTAQVATAAYCGSLLVVGVGRMLLTDAPFVLALSLALTTFYDSVLGDEKKRLWTAVALGFAVLAKGPVAVVLFALVAVFTFWRFEDLRLNFRRHWLTGFALFAAVVALWYVPAWLHNKDVFVQDFLIKQNLGRFSGGDTAHKTPIWAIPLYYPAVLLVALAPWSLWLVRSGKYQWPKDRLSRYLWVWALVVLCFFSASLTKLPHYALPAVFPLTVLAVLAVARGSDDKAFWLKCALAWSLAVAALSTVAFGLDYQGRFEELHRIAKELRANGGQVVLFESGRAKGARGALGNDTSKPSFLFYSGPDTVLTGDVAEIARLQAPVWLVVAKGRVDSELNLDLRLAGFVPHQAEQPFQTEKYEVWRLDAASPLGR